MDIFSLEKKKDINLINKIKQKNYYFQFFNLYIM